MTSPDPLAALWSARSIAIIGATEREGAIGRLPVQYLQRFEYEGRIIPVNQKGGSVLGIAAVTSITEAEGPIDLALVMVPATGVADAVAECAQAGVRVCVVMSAGFGEVDEVGQERQRALAETARAAGMRLVGPNCIGSVGGSHRVFATFSPVFSSPATPLPSGPLALVSQSGALGFGALSLGLERDIPIGIAVTTGNEADVTAEEVAAALATDSQVSGLLVYMESVADLNRLAAAARAVPTVVVKAGRSAAGAAAAQSHTGALTSSDSVVDAALLRAGVARVSTIDDLLDAGALIATGSRLTDSVRIGVITTSGGSGILAADAIEANGLALAALSQGTIDDVTAIIPEYGNASNPVDVTAAVMAQPGLFEDCVNVLAEDSNVDALVACFAVLVGDDVLRIAQALGSVRARTGKPVVAARTGAAALAPEGAAQLLAQGVPVYPTPERAVAALRTLRDACRPGRVESASTSASTPIPPPNATATEDQVKQWLAEAGLPVPESVTVASAAETRDAVRSVGGRAVVKAVVPGLLHKSDVGGVVIDVDEAEAEVAFVQCAALGGSVLVERFVPGGIEVLVGLTPSPLGRVLTVGVGGTLTEVVADVAVDLIPVDAADIDVLLDRTRVGALLDGVRGAAPVDRAALVGVIALLCDAVQGWPDDLELEINPIKVVTDGCWILDAVVHRTEESK